MRGQETAAETRQVIAGLMSRHDTASNGRFQRGNRAVLDQMRDGDRGRVEHSAAAPRRPRRELRERGE